MYDFSVNQTSDREGQGKCCSMVVPSAGGTRQVDITKDPSAVGIVDKNPCFSDRKRLMGFNHVSLFEPSRSFPSKENWPRSSHEIRTGFRTEYSSGIMIIPKDYLSIFIQT